MAATGILQDAVTAVKNALVALNLSVVDDPRNARPYSVMVELPSFDAFTYNVGDFTLDIRILSIPPSNKDATTYLFSVADTIMNSPIAITGGRPGLASYGGQNLPTYDLTARVAVKRT